MGGMRLERIGVGVIGISISISIRIDREKGGKALQRKVREMIAAAKGLGLGHVNGSASLSLEVSVIQIISALLVDNNNLASVSGGISPRGTSLDIDSQGDVISINSFVTNRNILRGKGGEIKEGKGEGRKGSESRKEIKPVLGH